jgi:hypothetical protein
MLDLFVDNKIGTLRRVQRIVANVTQSQPPEILV